jgi:hypothetical protein
VIDQQPHLAGLTIETSHRQIRFPQRRPSDRQRVDRMRVAVGPRAIAGVGHQLRWHPHDRFAGRQQVTLEPTGQMPTVLHRPSPLRPEPVGPPHQLDVISSCRCKRSGGEPIPNDGVGVARRLGVTGKSRMRDGDVAGRNYPVA